MTTGDTNTDIVNTFITIYLTHIVSTVMYIYEPFPDVGWSIKWKKNKTLSRSSDDFNITLSLGKWALLCILLSVVWAESC